MLGETRAQIARADTGARERPADKIPAHTREEERWGREGGGHRVLDGVTASSGDGLFSGLHVVENADIAQDHLDQLALIVHLRERKTE